MNEQPVTPSQQPFVPSQPLTPVKPKRSRKPILFVIIAIILIIAAGFGAYKWEHNRAVKVENAQRAQITSLQKQISSLQGQSNNQSGASSNLAAQYIMVKEWGVRVPVPSDVNTSDIYYVIKQAGSSSEAVLGSTKLAAIAPSCDPRGTGSTPFGWIERMAPSDYQQVAKDPQNTGVNNGILLGSYYYVWQVPRANCYGTAADGNSQLAAQISVMTNNNTTAIDNFPNNMITVLKSIETIN
jgi:hypothetical protein